jgi:hypothetical protein
VIEVLALLSKYGIVDEVAGMVQAFHARALSALRSVSEGHESAAFSSLSGLAERLAARDA